MPTKTRRLVLAAAILAGGVLAGAAARVSTGDTSNHDRGPCERAQSRAALAPDGEPGTRLVVRGRVFGNDGTTPRAGVIVYAYQTDTTGHYAPRPGDAPRLRAWARTAADGSFEFRTIRPAPYPGRRIPAHVHFQLWGNGVTPQWGEDLTFDDDPLVGADDRARSRSAERFGTVRTVAAAADGTSIVVHDLRLGTGLTTFEDNTRHGLAACLSD